MIRVIAWVTGSRTDTWPWVVLQAVAALAFFAAGVGWIYWRIEESRAGSNAGVVEFARPWVAPLLGVAALLGTVGTLSLIF